MKLYGLSNSSTSTKRHLDSVSNKVLRIFYRSLHAVFNLLPRHNVLRKSSGLEEMGSVQWHLLLSNLVGWVIVVGSLIKGVKSLGKASFSDCFLFTIIYILCWLFCFDIHSKITKIFGELRNQVPPPPHTHTHRHHHTAKRPVTIKT